MKKPKTKTQLKKILDSVFSKFIREKYSKDGYLNCYCCGRRISTKESQCMHYVSRANLATRWDADNARAGCSSCNVFMHGNYPAYTAHLLEEIGASKLKKLIAKGKTIRQWTIKDLEDEIKKYL